MEYSIHPAAKIIPEMRPDELENLRDSVRCHGQIVPIEILDGMILDGRHRYTICGELGIEPWVVELDPDQVPDPAAYIACLNRDRRHLNKSQMAMIAQAMTEYYKREAKERQKRKPVKSVPEIFPEQIGKGEARDKAGEACGVSGKLVDAARKVVKEGVPELADAVRDGKIAVSAAAKVADLPKTQQRKAVESGSSALRQAAYGSSSDKKTPLDYLKQWWDKATIKQRDAFLAWVDEQ
jgi:hypothetical protein